MKSPHSVSFHVDSVGLVREGDTGITPYRVTILRTGDDVGSPSTVTWEINIDDPDDLAPGQALSGTAFFGIGQRQVVIDVGIHADKVFEQDDMFEFKLVEAHHGEQVFDPLASTFGIIVNDDAPVTFDFSGPQIRAEGLSGVTPFDFVVIRTGNLGQASVVQWELQPGTADGLDFAPGQPLTGSVTFAAGATQAVIQIQVAGDVRPEPDETFILRLTQANTGTAVSMPNVSTTGTILDDDVRHALLVATPNTLVNPEGNAGATPFAYTLLRTGDLSLSVKIPYAVTLAPGGVSAAEVQSPLSGFVTFAAGSADAMLTILIGGDTTPEDNEGFQVTLGGGDFNTLTLSGVVMNDDQGAGGAAVASQGSAAPADMGGDLSSFMQHLGGGGLWSGDGGL